MSEPPRRWREHGLAPRLITIAVGAPALIALLWAGGWWLVAAVCVLAAVAAQEFRRLVDAVGYRSSPVLLAGALAFPVLAGVGRWDAAGPVVVAVVLAAAACGLTASRREGAPSGVAVDTLGALYVGALFAHLILMRAEIGLAAVLSVLGIIWANDIAAYLVGGTLGRRKLAPAISPGKSVEGFVGGLAAAVVVAMAAGAWQGWPVGLLGLIGLAVALAGAVGDLSKSTMKRAAGVKDSGAALPGHGGVLDRFDAVLFGVPAGYYLWRWLIV
ncbi:MAG: phosphatidate cytidylyltransferase [Armatimonadota bacterium]|nr:phosphatidate cytidylyltransferase [Armatimonadota bacterium]